MELNDKTSETRKTQCGCERCQRSIDEAREAKDARELALNEGADKKPAGDDPLKKEIGEFEAKTAVEVVRNGTQFEYKISHEGKDKVLATTDATTKGLEEATKKLAELIDGKQKELEKHLA